MSVLDWCMGISMAIVWIVFLIVICCLRVIRNKKEASGVTGEDKNK